ncbi:PP2C family protein-serine/threonine phosphatase [Sulfitobacter sp. JB4-11]|uniref:PP2C family protein-serine/threonine phosphatase n=1 Tax=Sulfitobacter rhodophyticola TaxID=3238304 RepID=UPI003519B62D
MTRAVSPTDPGAAAHAPRKNVLVVDDSRLQRRILTASLTRWGYDVTQASTAEEALAICQREMPDLVLSDWVMPGMSGIEFCRIFRDLSGDEYSYFILLTSKSDKAEVARGLGSGADDFLSKPVNNDELRARITVGERIIDMQRELTETNRLMSMTLEELQRVYDSLDHDLRQAKELQQSLLRERQKTLDQGHISLLLRSSGHVGGDLVGFFQGSPDKLGLFGIDVSGHGISSALMTARLAGYLSGSAPDQNVALRKTEAGGFETRPPAETIAELNELVLSEMDTEHYFTLMLAIVDLHTGQVTIAQAGHPHPVVLRADGRVEQTGTGGFPVGLLAGATFEQFDIQLAPGDSLLILSDGVTECPSSTGELLEEQGLEEILRSLGGMRGSALLEGLVWRLSEYAGVQVFPDDVSASLFEYTGPPTDR